jgi:RNA ligase (TIGR02306 family)
MSDHSCLVVKVKLEKHPNADNLSLVQIGGYQCVVRTDEWQDEQLAVYIPPDSIVPFKEPFKFLGENRLRIRARKFRGEYSYGLLIPAPDGAQEGDDYASHFGVEHYEPPIPMPTGGENVHAPPGIYVKYDVENYKSPKYNHIIQEGEPVVITEKIHGANARFVFTDNQMWAGSRKNWKKYDSKNLWWMALAQNPWIEEWCRAHPDHTLYGEVFGQVQNLKYGTKNGEVRFCVFDILKDGKWLPYSATIDLKIDGSFAFFDKNHLKPIYPSPLFLGWVPILYVGPFKKELALKLAEEDSDIEGANHYREGVVIRPVEDKWDNKLGRVQLKIVGGKYLCKT